MKHVYDWLELNKLHYNDEVVKKVFEITKDPGKTIQILEVFLSPAPFKPLSRKKN